MAAGMGLISDVIDFSQADDGAMVAYGISDQLDDLKVEHIFLTSSKQLQKAELPKNCGV